MSQRALTIWMALCIGFQPMAAWSGDPPPAGATKGAARTGAPAAGDDANNKVPASGSIDKFLEIQRLAELAENPDWLLVIAGIAIALWGGRATIADVGRVLTTTLPAAVKLHRISQILKIGEEAEKALFKMAEDLRPLGVTAKKSADHLQDHLNTVPEGLVHRRSLQNKTADQVKEKLAEAGVREAIGASAKGKAWLLEYDHRTAELDRNQTVLMNRFAATTAQLRNFSERTNALGKGFLRSEDLAHRPIEYQVFPTPNGPTGSLTLHMDGGFNSEVPDPRQLHLQYIAPLTKCRDLLAKVRNARDRNAVSVKMDTVVKPVSHLATVGLGIAVYRWGSNRIQKRTNVPPEQLLERAKSKAQLDAVREVIRNGEMSNVAELLREARRSGKDEDVKELYRLLREALRKQLPEIAASIRQNTDPILRDKAEFEKNLWAFLKNDDVANNILDSALAEAAGAEFKATSTDSIYGILFSTDPANRPQVNRLLMRHYGTSLKYLWPKLTVDGTAIPVDASHIADTVTDTTGRLSELGEKRQKRLNPTKEVEPKPAAGGPMAAARPTEEGNPKLTPGPELAGSPVLKSPAP